ncbi:MAG TPA: hypothetical protein DCS63_01120 [Elusimicrobia bacterium]|nr:hypothetical protein [Elusimicrobiota bacterium]
MAGPQPLDERHFYSILRLPTVIFIIVSNLLVLAGAFIWGWNLFTMLLVFWLESAIIGFYTVIKMFTIEPVMTFLTLPLYLAYFLFFLAVYFIAILSAFKQGHAGEPLRALIAGSFGDVSVLIGAAPLLISHGVSFFRNFWPRREMYRNKLNDIAFEPYPRIMLWVPVLVITAFLVQYAGGGRPQYGYPVIILVKACADIWSHLKANDLLPPEFNIKS